MTKVLDAPRTPHPAYLASRREAVLLAVKHGLSDSKIAAFINDGSDLIAAEVKKLRADGITPGEAGLLLRSARTATDGLRSTVMPKPLPLLGEGWTGSGSCSECYANHGSGSGYCGCECHNRWSASAVQQVTAPQSGLSFECGNGCHAPLCDGRNCSCSCHARSAGTLAAQDTTDLPVLTPPPNPAKPPKISVPPQRTAA